MKGKTLLCLLGLVSTAIPAMDYVVPEVTSVYADENKKRDADGKLTLEGIASLMNSKDCNAILSTQSNIEYVRYDRRTRKTNLTELIEQRNVRVRNRKPVVVLWYHNLHQSNNTEKDIASMRNSIILAEWVRAHRDNVKFIAYEVDVDSALAKNNYKQLAKTYGLKTIPSFSLYHAQDYVRRNEPAGINKIDVWRGAPSSNEQMIQCIQVGSEHWLGTNVLSPNGEWVRRTNNSKPLRFRKVNYNSK